MYFFHHHEGKSFFPTRGKVIHRHHFPSELRRFGEFGGLLASEKEKCIPLREGEGEIFSGKMYEKLLHQMVGYYCGGITQVEPQNVLL